MHIRCSHLLLTPNYCLWIFHHGSSGERMIRNDNPHPVGHPCQHVIGGIILPHGQQQYLQPHIFYVIPFYSNKNTYSICITIIVWNYSRTCRNHLHWCTIKQNHQNKCHSVLCDREVLQNPPPCTQRNITYVYEYIEVFCYYINIPRKTWNMFRTEVFIM